MELPQPLQSGASIHAIVPWSQRIVAYLRAITVRPSATVSVSTTANGTLLSAAPPSRTVRAAASSSAGLNQFLVTCRPPEDTPEDDQGQEGGQPPAERRWLVSVLGGTAQAMFGKITRIQNVVDEEVTIGEEECCFVSLVYNVEGDGDDIHAFSDEIDFHVGEEAPENTPQSGSGGAAEESKFYFPFAVVQWDGTVLQGHLGAVYLSGPRNLVELDERTEETVPDDEEEEGDGEPT